MQEFNKCANEQKNNKQPASSLNEGWIIDIFDLSYIFAGLNNG